MQIFHDPAEWQAFSPNSRLVFVPTMGALHRGHQALLEKARDVAGANGLVVSSLFINPSQFDQQEDFENYPQTWQSDCEICRAAGVDVLFAPRPESMYASDHSISVRESKLSQFLCGASRPGHFDGVCTIVTKLFCLFRPHIAIFGEKDFQQLAIIRRLVRDLHFPIEILSHPTVREHDGLALSSRNQRLSPEARTDAPRLYRALSAAAQSGKTVAEILKLSRAEIEASPLVKIDYLSLVDATTLEPAVSLDQANILAIAAFYGTVRLIDNVSLPAQS